jgi:tripartite-type tricarboxylate transporter receptor subunit TctC
MIVKLNQEITGALADPSLRDRIAEQGAVPIAMSPEELGKFMSVETDKWRNIITKAGIPQIQ